MTGRPILSFIIMLTLLCFCTFSFASGNGLRFRRVSLEHGLSQSTVNCVLQDRLGFMWFGTTDGLNKYDGYTFSVFRHDPEDDSSISDSGIWTLFEDRSGTIWVGTYAGLNRFDRETETFRRYTHDPNDPESLGHDSVVTIFEDHQGIFWIGCNGDGGLNRFDPSTGKFARFRNDPDNPKSIGHNVVWSVCEDRFGDLWVGTWGGGVNRFDRKTGEFVRYSHDSENPDSIGNNNAVTLCFDKAGTLWIGTWGGGLCEFDRESGKFTTHKNALDGPNSLGSNVIRAMCEDRHGVMWIGTGGGGLNRFDRKTGKFEHFKNIPNDPSSLSHDTVRAIYEDRSGGLWVGTWNGGLSVIDPDRGNGTFTNCQTDQNNPESLSHNSVWALCEDRFGAIWIGTWGGGLNKLDRETGRFAHFRADPKIPGSLNNNDVISVCVDRDGVIWAGTLFGLNRFDRETGTFSEYRFNPKGLNLIWTILEDRFGRLWVGANSVGLMEFDRKSSQFVRYPDGQASSQKLDTVLALHEDCSGTLWVGTWEEGLKKFDRDTGTFTRFVNDPENPESIGRNCVRTIFEDSVGRLWIGTWGGGLNQLSGIKTDASGRETATFVRYGKNRGFPNDVVSGILEDENGVLWISTFKGISKFDPKTGVIRNYDVRDRLQSDEFNLNSCLKTRDGEMFFGGINGLSQFRPNHIRDNPYVPPVVITDFRLFNKSVLIGRHSPGKGSPILDKSVNIADSIRLTHRENVFSFEFAALNYTIPKKNQYAYMMEGFDKEWVYCQDRRFVTYTNLNPGSYRFRVKGSNNDGIWNETGASVRIAITPPPWKTWWAYLLYCALFAGFVTALVHVKTKAQAKKLRTREKELSQERKIVRAQEKYRQIVENAVEGLFQISSDGQVLSANPAFAKILGYDSPEALIRSGAAISAGIGFPWGITGTERVSGFETRFRRKDGSAIWISLSARSIKETNGNRYEGVLLDITERKEKEKAEREREVAEAANRKIMDSIRYAELIRRALLLTPESLGKAAPDSFLIDMPRDVVGGDMIHVDEFRDGFFVAVIDCTGHGVPGAFMTLIVSSGLKRIIREEGCRNPGETLAHLNRFIKNSMNAGERTPLSHAGLDAAVCFVQWPAGGSPTPENTVLTFAGAKLPLAYVQNGECHIIKGDGQSIGYKRSDPDFRFTNHTIDIKAPVSFYMATDGFADQVGGEKGRRFGSGRFWKLLTENAHLPFDTQRDLLLKAFDAHKGSCERLDDVMVAGFGLGADLRPTTSNKIR